MITPIPEKTEILLLFQILQFIIWDMHAGSGLKLSCHHLSENQSDIIKVCVLPCPFVPCDIKKKLKYKIYPKNIERLTEFYVRTWERIQRCADIRDVRQAKWACARWFFRKVVASIWVMSVTR